MIIDTHHHFWNYNPLEFDWIDNEMAPIRKNFLPPNLKETITEAGVEGVVSVQARQSIEETNWLLQLASENDFIKGVVGWVPLVSPTIHEILDKYRDFPKLKGVRHVVQGELDPEFILRDDFNNGISILKNYNLVYDILILESQLPNTIKFVQKHPEQQFVVDHVAKPKIKTNEIKEWQKNMKEIARHKNVAWKISGMVTEADYKNWTEKQLNPYIDTVLEIFAPERVMFGSDWPVCLVATNYKSWLDLVKKKIQQFSTNEQEQILYKNAIGIYNLKHE